LLNLQCPFKDSDNINQTFLSSIQHSDQNNAYVYRYFNVIGSDPEGRLGEAPRPELREHGRISGACFDAARGITPGLKVT